jgi:hypothetical protein
MGLTGFGHDVSFGAQANGSATYLWTEVDPNKGGYGARLARFKLVSGTTLSHTSTNVKKFTRAAAAIEHMRTIELVTKRMVVRYHMSGGKHIAVYSLADATKGNFTKPLANFKRPTPKILGIRFQGYTAYGQCLYLLTGDSYEDSGGRVNSEVTSIDMNTGIVKQGPILAKAGSTLKFRKPEGLAIYQTASGEVRLFLGFASRDPGDRRSNLYYKSNTLTT